MKKSIALVALAFGVTNAFAQDLTSKKGEPYLPEAGDWGLAIDATPFLNYAGNFFGKSANNVAPTWNWFNGSGTAQTITGKYFVDATKAYRGSVRIGINSNTQRNNVQDRLAAAAAGTVTGYPSSAKEVENSWKRSNTVVGLAAGMEMRKGKTRLQGYYGGEAGIYMDMQKDKFVYGNALAATTTASLNVDVDPTDDAFSGSNNLSTTANIPGMTAAGARATEIKRGTIFSFGVRGFIGAEYFILPKMSLGGEFGWGLGISSQGKSSTTWESVGNASSPASGSNSVGTTTLEGAKDGSFWLDTDGKNSIFGPTASLRLNLHF